MIFFLRNRVNDFETGQTKIGKGRRMPFEMESPAAPESELGVGRVLIE